VLCSLSGTTPEEPVVSRRTGHVFEKRLITKHLADSGRCPVTDEDLSPADLIALQVPPTARPRPASAQGVPGMLLALQNEWDALMLESHELRKQLNTARQELAHSLYQNDAAVRVIARLTDERDEARAALAQTKAFTEAEQKRMAPAEPAEEPGQLPKAVRTRVTEVSKQLQAERKKRKPSPALLTSAQVATMAQTYAVAPHSASTPGLLCCAQVGADGVATGGNDAAIVLFSRTERKVQQKLQGHAKAVRQVVANSAGNLLLSGSEDSTVRVWRRGGAGQDFVAGKVHREHTKPITGLSLAATGEQFLATSMDGSWSVFDIESERCLLTKEAEGAGQAGWTCSSLHPDGMLVGMGTKEGGSQAVCVWTLAKMQTAARFEVPGVVTCLAFSENGYHMATGGEDGTVKLWDLRKPQAPAFNTLVFDDSNPSSPTPVHSLAYESSGLYLAIGTKSLKLYETRKEGTNELVTLRESTDAVTGILWGADAKWVLSTGLDRQARIYEPHSDGDTKMD